MGVSKRVVAHLRASGHHAEHLRELGLPRLADREILKKALDDGSVILTFDLDFGDLLAAGGGLLPSVVLFRLRDQTPESVIERLDSVVSSCREHLETGAVVTVETNRYRVHRLPIVP